MANRTLVYRAILALQDIKFDRIIFFTTWCDRMCAVMTGFTIQASVFGGEAVERMILVVLPTVVACVAARLVQPGIGVVFHISHATMTVNACHPFL